jgi:hypothetical protein
MLQCFLEPRCVLVRYRSYSKCGRSGNTIRVDSVSAWKKYEVTA